jgi:ABC-type transport system involved in multi-copper enzyme maturation permease subunit
MVLTKPAPRWLVWTGKWLGVFLMQAFLFVVAALVVLALVRWKVENGGFPPEELAQLKSEVLVGRRVFDPDQPDFMKLMKEEYQRRLKEGTLSPDHNPRAVMLEILRQSRARSTEVPFEMTRGWRFRGVEVAGPDTSVYLRYRMYVGSDSTSDQRFSEGTWGVQDPTAKEPDTFAVVSQRVMGGVFHEMTFPGSFVDHEKTAIVTYTNQDAEKASLIFQTADGPALLVARTSFTVNYLRASLLVLLQLAFLAALGCTVGAVFSTPVAIFVAVSYLVIGLTVQAAVTAPLTDELGGYEYKNVAERMAHYMALGVGKLVVSVDDFDASSDLAKGRLIEVTRMLGALFGLVVLRSLPLAGLGAYLFTRRELGTVIRR